MNQKILYLVTSFQNSDEKVEHVISFIEKLKSMGVDICFSTHVGNGLDRISKLCEYVIFDNDNNPVKLPDAVEVIGSFPEHNLSKFYTFKSYWLGQTNLIINNRFVEYHVKPALSLLKNGVLEAKKYGYDWIVYMEYDTLLPENGFDLKGYFENLSVELEKKNLKGLFYLCEGEDGFRNNVVWPFMLLGKTDLFTENEELMSNWDRSEKTFFQTYGNLSFEEILQKIGEKNNKVEFRNAFRIKEDMGYNFNNVWELSIFGSESRNDKRITQLKKYLDFDLVAVKKENNLFDLNIIRSTSNFNSEEDNLDDVIFLGIDVTLEGEKIFTTLINENYKYNGFHIWGLLNNLTPKLDNQKLNFKASVITKDEIHMFYDFTLNLYDIENYYRFIKSMDIINQ